jgi:ATP-dependent helicase/DNAse subunit B
MLLLTGPPGSGKTHQVLDLFRAGLARDDARLLVPTATMAEHLRHRLAREGLVFRPSRIRTLAAFLDEWTPDLRQASPAALRLALEDALEGGAPPLFRPVADLAGFQSSLAALIDELAAAGCDARRLLRISDGDETCDAVAAVWSAVDARLRRRGLASRADRLRLAALRVRDSPLAGVRAVFVDGFFSFSDPELDLLASLRERADLFVTLPRWEGAEESAVRLRARGLVERECPAVRPVAARSRFLAPAPALEAEEIARRMIALHDGGRAWRQMGVVVRRASPYAAILAAAFDRFGVPARFYFAEPLEASSLARSLLAGRALPDAPAPFDEGAPWRRIAFRRREAAAAAAFDAAVQEVSAFDPETDATGALFRFRLRAVASMTPLRTPDRRRDVVHVMDVQESRQWELPVVFVCGLYEGGFPARHGQHPILGDDARRRLRERGVFVRASGERRREEEFLFSIALTRATESLVLSRPVRDSFGVEVAPSSFLDGEPDPVEPSAPARPRPSWRAPLPSAPAIRSEDLLASVARRNATVSPSAIEAFLQCPFLFFAQRTLGLRAPEQPLGALAQGSIFHTVLAALPGTPLLAESVFEENFEDYCRRAGVPEGWRKESVRGEMLRSLRAFLAGAERPLTPAAITERNFEFPLAGGLSVRGKIDRIDLDPSGRAAVIDYKYSAEARLKSIVKGHRDGTAVQGGLYAIATLSALNHPVRSVLFATVRGGTHWDGWHGDEIDDLARRAREITLDAVARIREGRIAPDPADPSRCAFCDYRDACRIEMRATRAVAGRP